MPRTTKKQNKNQTIHIKELCGHRDLKNKKETPCKLNMETYTAKKIKKKKQRMNE